MPISPRADWAVAKVAVDAGIRVSLQLAQSTKVQELPAQFIPEACAYPRRSLRNLTIKAKTAEYLNSQRAVADP